MYDKFKVTPYQHHKTDKPHIVWKYLYNKIYIRNLKKFETNSDLRAQRNEINGGI